MDFTDTNMTQEEQRVRMSFEEINADYVKRLEADLENSDDRLGYTQCDKCYEHDHKMHIKNNGTICQWLLK